ncbi:MAG: 6-bladed beta-propeller [Gemmatimonadota bacterium]|nr:6-bladed beta-propeller [Gemmatimonadota bacterium]
MIRCTGIASGTWSAAVSAAVTLILGTGCDDQPATDPRIEIDSAGVRVVTIDPFASDAACSVSEEPTFYIGDSEESDEQWFTRVLGAVRLSDGSVAVADDYTMQVRIFDKSGAYIRSMGREGEGPGEFKRLWYLWRLPGDTLWVGDYRPWRYQVYASTGEWIRTVTMDPVYPNPTRAGGVLANGVSINSRDESARPQDFSAPDKRHVEAHGPDGKLIGILATLPGRTFGQVDDGTLNYYLSPWYDSNPTIDAEGRTIVTANGRDPEVRVLDDEMRLRLIIRWGDPGGKVTSADIQAAREAERRRALEDGEISQFEEANLSPKRPGADVFPAVSSVRAGVDGTVWVYRYRRPGAPARPRLMAFSPDGAFVCHLATGKSGFTIREFGADYVLGTHTNELGVQHVAMYDLMRPGATPE